MSKPLFFVYENALPGWGKFANDSVELSPVGENLPEQFWDIPQ